MAASVLNPSDINVHLLWLTAEVGCSRDSTPLANATLPGVENVVAGSIPGLPRVVLHWQRGNNHRGAGFIQSFWKAAAGELDPFVLIVEGSIPNDDIKSANDWSGTETNGLATSRVFDQQVKTTEWLDRLAPMATVIVAAGTCATYGGVTGLTGNRGGVMGVPDYLGWNWKSKAGLPVVCVPGCPVQPDNLTETLLYLLYHVSGQAPVVPLDENLRPAWLFGGAIDEGCERGGQRREGGREYRSSKCLAKTGRRGSAPEIVSAGARTGVAADASSRRIATNRAKWRHAS
jgi:hydrogenase small subunit